MKRRSQAVIVTLATLSLDLTGCQRPSSQGHVGPSVSDSVSDVAREIVNPENLGAAFDRSQLPQWQAPSDLAGVVPPLNGFMSGSGYYHNEVSSWYPLPYGYYHNQWGFYRNGRWSRHNHTNPDQRTHYHSSNGLVPYGSVRRVGSPVAGVVGAAVGAAAANMANSASRTAAPQMHEPPDYDTPPTGAPVHGATTHATVGDRLRRMNAARPSSSSSRSSYSSASRSSGSSSQGGFGSTGRSSSSSSSS